MSYLFSLDCTFVKIYVKYNANKKNLKAYVCMHRQYCIHEHNRFKRKMIKKNNDTTFNNKNYIIPSSFD